MLSIGNQTVQFHVFTDDLSVCPDNVSVYTTHPKSALEWVTRIDGVVQVVIGSTTREANADILAALADAVARKLPLDLIKMISDMQEVL